MRRALFWYGVLLVGGFILLVRSIRWLGHEMWCIVSGREKDRLFRTCPANPIFSRAGGGG